MFDDIRNNDRPKTNSQRMQGSVADKILYADDTICIKGTVPAMNRLVKEIETGSKVRAQAKPQQCEDLCFGTKERPRTRMENNIP